MTRDGAWEAWSLYMLDAIASTSQWTTKKIISIRNLVEAKIAKRQTASECLKKLVGIGVLTEKHSGRERLFIHPKLIQLITTDNNEVESY